MHHEMMVTILPQFQFNKFLIYKVSFWKFGKRNRIKVKMGLRKKLLNVYFINFALHEQYGKILDNVIL